jgi:hypothetical protein
VKTGTWNDVVVEDQRPSGIRSLNSGLFAFNPSPSLLFADELALLTPQKGHLLIVIEEEL